MKSHRKRPSEDQQRPQPPKGWTFSPQCKDILLLMSRLEGVITPDQVQASFLNPTTASGKRAERLLYGLWCDHWLNRPEKDEFGFIKSLQYWHTLPDSGSWSQSKIVYWPSTKGKQFIADMDGIDVGELSYLQKPRYGMLDHDLTTNMFQIIVRNACMATPGVRLVEWRPGRQFYSQADLFTHHQVNEGKPRKIIPDSFFSIELMLKGTGNTVELKTLNFFVEIDRTSNPMTVNRITREKIIPQAHYIGSSQYQKRFGASGGRTILITSGQARVQHLKKAAEESVQRLSQRFLFTTFEAITPESILGEPIFWQGTNPQPVSLLRA